MVKRIVLTGGPGGGKTTALARIEQELCEKGYKVFIVKESATELINGGIIPREDGIGMFNFQKLIMRYQYQKEEIYNRAVSMSNDDKIVIIYDRGLLDNKSYISDLEFEMVLNDLSDTLGSEINEIDLVSRYDMVIHLVTSAGNVGYTLENNKARSENQDEAILLDKRTMNSWVLHNNLQIVDNTVNFQDKMDRVMELIYTCIGEQTLVKKEKKFIVDCVLNEELLERLNGVVTDIWQCYIDMGKEEEECRLRKTTYKHGSNYYYVVQNGCDNGVKKVLMERKINEKEFNRLMNLDMISSVEKRRITFTYNKQFFKLDLFSDGLMLLEVALSNEKDNVVIPDCFKIIRDVTDDCEYKNINLGRFSRDESIKRVKTRSVN